MSKWSLAALALLSLCVAHLACAVGNRTDTPEPTDSRTRRTATESGSEQASRSASVSADESSSRSLTDTLDPGLCTAEYSVLPLNFNTMPFSSIVGYPEDRVGDVFHFNDIESVRLQEDGFSVAVRLQRGVFFPSVTMPIAFKIIAKSQLVMSALAPAENSALAEADLPSTESHGITDFWPAKKNLFRFRRTNNLISLDVSPLSGYRIALDEWIIVMFYFNATAPLGCATKPAVLRVTSHRPSFYVSIVGAVALVIIIAGIIAAAALHTIPSSHHASMVAILAWSHFAQEDGAELPLALSPFQLTFSTTKYRYVRGAMYGNAGIILVSFIGQHLAMWYLRRRKNYAKEEAARNALYPRLTSAVVMHFAGPIMFSCGRSFGNQTSVSFIVTSLVLLLTLWVMVKTHRVNVSSTMNFQAEFVGAEVPNSDPLMPRQAFVEQQHNTFLTSMRGRFTLQPIGYWRSTDTAAAFVPMYGYVFESYKPEVKHWLLIEVVDVCITALLSVFDNYTPFLAFYQFGVTLLVKMSMLIYLIRKKPLLTHQSATALLATYGGQTIGYLALAIGSLRLELRRTADIVQGVGCVVALAGLLYDVFVHMTTAFFHFYDLYNRQKLYTEHDETAERRLELTETLRRGKTAAA